jgi:hypothetical protein
MSLQTRVVISVQVSRIEVVYAAVWFTASCFLLVHGAIETKIAEGITLVTAVYSNMSRPGRCWPHSLPTY